MKIRGNTVGTTIKPERAVVKATDLTEEQKAQARENIGITIFGVPYSSAIEVIGLNTNVKMYLFATADGYDAVVIGEGAIPDYTADNRPYNAEQINRLHIGDGVTSIGNYFMYGAYNLKSLTFDDIGAITHLGAYAFALTQIDGAYNFSGITDTELNCPFSTCKRLEGVTFNGNISTVAEKSFEFCTSLKYVKGLTNVTSIGNAAFQYCTSLESLDLVPQNVTLGYWVFILTPPEAVVYGSTTLLSEAQWGGMVNDEDKGLCFVPNVWTENQLAEIRNVTGESVKFPIPDSDNQRQTIYQEWGLLPRVYNNTYMGYAHKASGTCTLFCLFHIYNILHPNAQYDTYYDFIKREIQPRKIKVTQSLYDALNAEYYGQLLMSNNTAVSYEVGSEISATDLTIAFDDLGQTAGQEGTAFWGVCQALGWTNTRISFGDGDTSGADVKRVLLQNLADGKPVVMGIVGAAERGHSRHAVTAIGYDAETDRLLIIDSTGPFPADVAPLVYWCKFESLITPNEASELFTFVFNEVVTMSSVNDKLDALLKNATFSIEKGTVTPSANSRTITVDGVPANAKIVEVRTNGTFSGLASSVRPVTYVTFTAFPEKGATTSYVNLWIEYLSSGATKGTTAKDASIIANSLNIDSGNDALLFIGGTTYEWTAYCWGE